VFEVILGKIEFAVVLAGVNARRDHRLEIETTLQSVGGNRGQSGCDFANLLWRKESRRPVSQISANLFPAQNRVAQRRRGFLRFSSQQVVKDMPGFFQAQSVFRVRSIWEACARSFQIFQELCPDLLLLLRTSARGSRP